MPAELRSHKFYKSRKGPNIPPLTICDEYIRGEAGRHWGLKPWEFEALSAEHQARLRAHFDVHRLIENYYNTEHARYMDSLDKGK